MPAYQEVRGYDFAVNFVAETPVVPRVSSRGQAVKPSHDGALVREPEGEGRVAEASRPSMGAEPRRWLASSRRAVP